MLWQKMIKTFHDLYSILKFAKRSSHLVLHQLTTKNNHLHVYIHNFTVEWCRKRCWNITHKYSEYNLQTRTEKELAKRYEEPFFSYMQMTQIQYLNHKTSNGSRNIKLPNILTLPQKDDAFLATGCYDIIDRMACETSHTLFKLYTASNQKTHQTFINHSQIT